VFDRPALSLSVVSLSHNKWLIILHPSTPVFSQELILLKGWVPPHHQDTVVDIPNPVPNTVHHLA
jgi:hypothetical protein